MDDIYQTIELQFYKDLKKSENEFRNHKNIVEQVMKENSVDYALELVENQKKSAYQEAYIKGYTLNLIIRKIDLHYVLKLLDENKIGFFSSDEEKWEAISENVIEEDYEEDENETDKIQTNNIIDDEEIRKQNAQANKFARVSFSIIFLLMIFLDISLSYWLYNNQKYGYLAITIILTFLQLLFFKFFLKFFEEKVDHL